MRGRSKNKPDAIDEFWAYIDVLGGQAKNVDALVQVLRATDRKRVIRFSDTLARCLHALDRRELFEQPVAEPGEDQDDEAHLSDDGFLYARCAVIAAGRRRYEQVLADPTSFGGTWDTGGEALLDVAERAWEKLTGTDWEHEDPVPVWTGSNPDGGWPQDRQVRDFDPVLLDLAGSAARWPDGRVHYNTAHQDCLMVTGPQVETETVALLRAHGGWPPPIAYLIVILKPANYWNFEVHRASGYLDEQGYGRPSADGEHGQKYLRATVMVSKDQQRTWDVDEQLRALRAVVAHVLIDELSRVAPNHGALPTLRQHLDEARQLLPSLPRYA